MFADIYSVKHPTVIIPPFETNMRNGKCDPLSVQKEKLTTYQGTFGRLLRSVLHVLIGQMHGLNALAVRLADSFGLARCEGRQIVSCRCMALFNQ